MRTYWIAQELYSILCGDLTGKKTQKREDMCMHKANSLCLRAETKNYIVKQLNPNKNQLPKKRHQSWFLLSEVFT